MTGTYDWNPMPHRVDVRCPECAGHARFKFAELVRIKRREDVPFFKSSRVFDYMFVRKNHQGQSFHGAFFFAGLHGSDTSAIHDLPEGYEASEWRHSRYLFRSHGTDLGAVVCPACGLRRRHQLTWPDDAWWQWSIRRHQLWAFDRDSTAALRAFVSAKIRKGARQRYSSFLLHVPTAFLTGRVRDEVIAKIEKSLAP